MRLSERLTNWVWTLFPGLNPRIELRAHWTKPGDADGWGASWYFDLLRQRLAPAQVLDDKTWADLEFPRFFTAIDTTITPVGRQCLFAQLRTYEFDTARLDEHIHAYGVLQANQRLREDLQLGLKPLQTNAANWIADMLLGPAPKSIPYGRLFLPWTLISIAAVIAGIAHLVPVWVCALPLVVNMVVALIFSAKLSRKVDALLGVARLLRVANRLAAVRSDATFSHLQRLVSETEKRRRLGEQIKWLGAQDRIRSQDLIGGLAVTANMLFLLKFTLYARSIERFVNSREEWLSTFQLIGAVDAAIAIAGFLCRYPDHCRPEVDDSVLAVENGYHAFIAEPVKNSIRLERRSALITGSNMTGKTTFIKMVAMNAILGRTLGVCLADKATFPRSAVRALVRADQSVAAGKSRYFAESESIREFITEAQTGSCWMFVLDEPFSGTNTVERIAIAKAVLRAIGARAQLLVTTHDVELQYLLGDGFELYYFQENPAVEGYFDHLLHAGASAQRNAIRVLERLGYPADIIAEALATVPLVEKSAS